MLQDGFVVNINFKSNYLLFLSLLSFLSITICLFCFGFWFSGKRRSSRFITNSIPEDIKKCYVCHGFEDEVTTELLQCSKCSAVG